MEGTVHNKLIPKFLKEPRTLLQIGVICTCLGVHYFPVFKSMAKDWMEQPDFSHGFLIPLISLYFFWERRDRLDKAVSQPRNTGLIIICSGILLLLMGNLASEAFTMRFSFLLVLAGIIVFLLGWSHAKLLSLPIAFLIFMIPIPSILMQKVTFPMQLFASRLATFSLHQLDIPALREGNIIRLTHTSLEVAEACSGIRSLMSLLALGVVFAYFSKKEFWQRAILVLSCFPIAVFVNALRVSATGVLANYYGMSIAEGFFHGFSGYILFLVALVLLVGVGFLLSRFDKENAVGL